MIIAETVNNDLIRHYSDSGLMIRQEETGVLYDEAVDVSPCRFTYTETDQYISEETRLSSMEDRAEAYNILMGVSE